MTNPRSLLSGWMGQNSWRPPDSGSASERQGQLALHQISIDSFPERAVDMSKLGSASFGRLRYIRRTVNLQVVSSSLTLKLPDGYGTAVGVEEGSDGRSRGSRVEVSE